MIVHDEQRLKTGFDYLAASLTSGPSAHDNRMMLRRYLDHYDTAVTGSDSAADRIERLAYFFQLLAGAALVERSAK